MVPARHALVHLTLQPFVRGRFRARKCPSARAGERAYGYEEGGGAIMQHIEAQASQESVWDYPRPPRVEPTGKRVRVVSDRLDIADSTRTLRVLETSHPPVYYIPPEDVRMEALALNDNHTFCEFKGEASYYDLVIEGRRVRNVAWTYLSPALGYEDLRGYVAFYPGRVDGAFVDGDSVTPQDGHFYGGWITPDLAGPFKGGSGTFGW
jgi:uncharacterized protein (DUF427 family)